MITSCTLWYSFPSSQLHIYVFLIFISDEVAVIDEIQMMRDTQRGWAWTRALLGLIVRICICICL